jgi:hypothetical protein
MWHSSRCCSDVGLTTYAIPHSENYETYRKQDACFQYGSIKINNNSLNQKKSNHVSPDTWKPGLIYFDLITIQRMQATKCITIH